MRAASSLGNGGSRGEMVLFQVSPDWQLQGTKNAPSGLVYPGGEGLGRSAVLVVLQDVKRKKIWQR